MLMLCIILLFQTEKCPCRTGVNVAWTMEIRHALIAPTLEKQELFSNASVSYFAKIPPGNVDATTGEN